MATTTRTYAHTPKGRTTHRIAEVQGISVLTGCGRLLTGYSEITVSLATTPTCRACARAC